MRRGTLDDLAAFAAVARTCSFTRAAAELGLSPSALSHAVRGLEALREEGLLPTHDAREIHDGGSIAVKAAVLPFKRFRTKEGDVVDSLLGPEMRSTGEVMGIDADFGAAFAKSQLGSLASGLPTSGNVFVSVANRDKRAMIFPIKRLADLGFTILATQGTADVLRRNAVECEVVTKHSERGEGESSIVERILAGDVDIVFEGDLAALRARDRLDRGLELGRP